LVCIVSSVFLHLFVFFGFFLIGVLIDGTSMKQHPDPEYVAHFKNAINNNRFWPTEFVKKKKRPWWNFFR
jgi:hypothetical protein